MTSSTLLNRSIESRHSCLVLIFERRFSVFHHWVWCLLWVFYIWLLLYCVGIVSLYSWFVEWVFFFFLLMNVFHFFIFFFCINWMVICFLPFILLTWCIISIDFFLLNHPCIPGINLTWAWFVIFVICSWIWFTSILLRVFASVFIRDIDL